MELHSAARLRDAFPIRDVCKDYLDRLPLAPEQCRALLSRISPRCALQRREAMAELHAALAGPAQPIDPANPAFASVPTRHILGQGVPPTGPGASSGVDGQAPSRLPAQPAIRRRTMAPSDWPPKPDLGLFAPRRPQTASGDPSDEEAPPPDSAPQGWQAAGTMRRLVLLALIFTQVYFSTTAMMAVLPYHGQRVLEVAILILFAMLSGWVAIGFWTAIAGFALKLAGGDRYAISAGAAADAAIGEGARTAVIMPICDENVARVFAGLRATYESLARTGELRHFDFFVLSDSGSAEHRVAEINAWVALCRAVHGFGRVFYRWRQHRIKRKSGNVADFCRRWGANYRYMVVLDADSVMSGECLVHLVRLMEANTGVGIIQTVPRVVGRDTLHARMQQFASRVYGPIFVAGLHFWQLGESYYWGHNAILRVAPFMRHCALGRLSGRGPLSGEILSHDFVEGALMRRAGWTVWIAYDLPGSYEEMPPNLVDELKRDRRWCQGNLMNLRMFMAKGVHPAHRAVFMTGAAAYLSGPLWLGFLFLSTVQLAVHTLVAPDYFTHPFQLFPLWPEWDPQRAIILFLATAALLFLPKILSVMLIWIRAQHFGGRLRLALSMLMESLFSALLAPIRMLFHSSFVLAALLGTDIKWKSPSREDAETGWGEALRRHGWHTLLGLAWAGGVYWLKPSYLLWLLPVVGALILSIPISVFSSRVSLGSYSRKQRFFLIPEELKPPEELLRTHEYAARAAPQPGFIEAVVDPATNALICAAGTPRTRPLSAAGSGRERLVDEALRHGPGALDSSRKMHLLNDPAALSRLHFEVWASAQAHPAWHRACIDPGNRS